MSKARTLILDIETAPILANVWRTWKENVGLEQIRADWYILSFACKWLGEKKTFYFDQSKARNIEDDTDLMAKLWEFLDQADFIVAHNGRRFDLKKINARFIIKGFKPPSPYRIIDTLDIAKGQFAFTSNRLAYLTDTLCTQKKLSHAKFPGFALWKECLAGNAAAWKEMKVYNIQDVISLEELYLKLRTWDTNHPNVAALDDPSVESCPKCGGSHMVQRGHRFTQVGKYARFQCVDCGGWARGRVMQNTRDVRKNLLVNA